MVDTRISLIPAILLEWKKKIKSCGGYMVNFKEGETKDIFKARWWAVLRERNQGNTKVFEH